MTDFEINLSELARAIQTLIAGPGRLYDFNSSMLTIYCSSTAINRQDASYLMSCGTKPFDAVIYSLMPPGTALPLHTPLEGDSSLMLRDAKHALLHLYLFTLLTGNHPTASETNAHVPSFVKKLVGIHCTAGQIASDAASFNLRCIDPSWIKSINVSGMHQSIRSRLALGLPGYRQLNAIKLLTLKASASTEMVATHEWLLRNLCRGYYWDVYPITRSHDISSKFPTLSKSLNDFIAVAYDPVSIQKMVALKVLFTTPSEDERYRSWRDWSNLADLQLQDEMFVNRAPPPEPQTPNGNNESFDR